MTLGLRLYEGKPGDWFGSGIFVARSDGSGVRRLALGWVSGAVWSPDGSRIVYENGDELWAMGAGGHGKHRLLRAHDAVWGAWSPDGRQIAYSIWIRKTSGLPKGAIGVMGADGSKPRLIKKLNYGPEELDWSPDGSKIAFAVGTGFNTGIYLLNSDGSGLRKIATDLQEPRWSPDGKRLAATGEESVYLVNPRTGQKTLLKTGWLVTGLSWSPDGKRLLLASGSNMATLDLKSRRLKPLTHPDPCRGVDRCEGLSSLDWSSQP